jgi:hypothetical protein
MVSELLTQVTDVIIICLRHMHSQTFVPSCNRHIGTSYRYKRGTSNVKHVWFETRQIQCASSSYFPKMKVSLWDHHPVYLCVCVCLSVCLSPLSTFEPFGKSLFKFSRLVMPFRETSMR